MTTYITHAEYSVRGGKLEGEAFAMLEADARSYVDLYTFGRIAKDVRKTAELPYAEQLKSTMVAVIDILAACDDVREVASVSNNGISVSYRDGSTIESVIARTVRRYLMYAVDADGVPLCYVGVS